MNYFELHIGDYAQATGHLSFVEDAAYMRLVRKYYAEERPIPSDLKAAQRLIGARTRDEKEAVQTVLDEFFELQADGWHQRRCDFEIARYQDKQAKAKRSAEARWNPQRSQSDGNANASDESMRTHSEGNAHQAPATNHQSPDTSQEETQGAPVLRAGAPGEACKAMRAAGIQAASPSDVRLLALLQAGATVQEFADVAAEAVEKRISKPFPWVLTVVENRRRDAARVTPLPPARGKRAAPQSFAAQSNTAFAPSIAARAAPLTIDEEPRHVTHALPRD